MNNFVFYNPTKIIFGKETIRAVGKEIPKGSKVMITFGGGSIKRNKIYDEVLAALAGFEVTEFGGIEPNPTYETLMQCVERVLRENIDYLLAVGGGSVIDGTKFIAAAALYQGEPWEIVKKYGMTVERALPFGTVLTLPATGSEMNSGAVITHRALNAKLPFNNQVLFPEFSVLDPTKTYTLPAEQIGNGVVDTFVHVTEQYLTYPVNGKLQDRFAEGILLTLIEEGPKALAEPENYDVRANLMWCATLGLNGLISAGVPQDWATHMIGHELTALKGLDHGKTLAVVLPAMLKIRAGEKKEKLLQYAQRVWGIQSGDDEARIEMAIEKTRDFFERMGVSTRLCQYGIDKGIIPEVVGQLKAHGMVRLGEKRDVTPELVAALLQDCL
ncbi:MAG TPA: iron-containing alcohol dehydrogenase [Smithellaceae bacterium]|nr:iron-containing alcohol dehydrogenase [Smithellaceae bacterium]HPL96165.1 iron-containing alcohol dehydrogenase [Smithellaceae bacterium]HQF85175.1 iron-containing alcohol dehydrogenase [Smithellaceae bacterium]HQG81339.1 iron-containing alcohol dehydrogenase [Smithellaceae bacterium]